MHLLHSWAPTANTPGILPQPPTSACSSARRACLPLACTADPLLTVSPKGPLLPFSAFILLSVIFSDDILVVLPEVVRGAPLVHTSISASYSSFLFRALLPHAPPLTSDLAVSVLLLWAFSKSGCYFFPQHELSRLRNMLPSPLLKKKSSLKSAFFLRSNRSFLLSFNPTVQPHSSDFIQGSFFLFRSLNSTSNDRNTFLCNKSGHYRQSPSSWGITPSSHTVHSSALFLIPCLFSDYCQSISIHVYPWETYI